MKLLLQEHMCSWCHYLFEKRMKFAHPAISLKSSHPVITRVIVSMNTDNNLNLLWQKQRRIQFSFRFLFFENVYASFLRTAILTVTELTKLTNHNNILIEDANKLDLGRFHSNIFIYWKALLTCSISSDSVETERILSGQVIEMDLCFLLK